MVVDVDDCTEDVMLLCFVEFVTVADGVNVVEAVAVTVVDDVIVVDAGGNGNFINFAKPDGTNGFSLGTEDATLVDDADVAGAVLVVAGADNEGVVDFDDGDEGDDDEGAAVDVGESFRKDAISVCLGPLLTIFNGPVYGVVGGDVDGDVIDEVSGLTTLAGLTKTSSSSTAKSCDIAVEALLSGNMLCDFSSGI